MNGGFLQLFSKNVQSKTNYFIGILLSAKKKGLLAQIKPELGKLVESGIHIHPNLINEALKVSGEL